MFYATIFIVRKELSYTNCPRDFVCLNDGT